MKIALLGKGKTGSKVQQLHTGPLTVFDTTHPITLENLKGHDVVISFLPGHVLMDYLNILMESKIPVASGSTGITYPSDFDQRLKQAQVKWIWAGNFSLGMNVVKIMIEKMSLLKKLFPEHHSTIHEIHHIHKKDSPSGTALSWQQWYGGDCEVTADRQGDVVGYHELTFDSATEKIKLSHEAKDRAIFAQGALWAANLLVTEKDIPYGLNQFNQVVAKFLNL